MADRGTRGRRRGVAALSERGPGRFERWIDRPGRDVRAATLTRPYEFESPFGGAPFALLVVVAAGAATATERNRLCDEILESGCLYVLCAGADCETWHDVLDECIVGARGESPYGEGIGTTWHARQTPDETVDFLLDETRFEGRPFTRYLVAFVGDDPCLRAEYAAIVRARGA